MHVDLHLLLNLDLSSLGLSCQFVSLFADTALHGWGFEASCNNNEQQAKYVIKDNGGNKRRKKKLKKKNHMLLWGSFNTLI